ncbi:hypothetical protein OCA8868_00852 [Octadecabacter ascidiaceicola]|uniref:DUF2306 domain-containing protein n=2 Tax=Octadecabacter ascidiaceicola TaxID=1655543 RepID=A0A238JQL2_9RHOB|nr:hypothetical protein OCA8868_00852 [Octadecabacter ascidiaceicola]
MSLDPILSAPVYLQIHVASALVAVTLGPVPMYRRRRDMVHKVLGYVWVVAMASVALSSFWIHSFAVIGPFSPLHGLALLTLWSLWRGISSARMGDIKTHLATFRALYWYGLLIAGLANFLPDRRINEIAFGGQDQLGWVVISLGAAALLARALRGRNTQVFWDIGAARKIS